MQQKQNSFLKGAAILGIAGIIVKVMGVFFRIPLTNWIGAEGMSYYSSVYPIYSFFLLISLAGIPVAISRMISERTSVKNYAGAQKVFNVSVIVMAVIGGVSMAIVYFGADFIDSSLLKNPGTKYALQAIAPALFLVPVMGAYRGYFQGRQNMNPTAVSQIIEQLFRVVIGLSLSYYLIRAGVGYDKISASAIFGGTAGAAAGLFVAVIIYLLNRRVIFRQIARHRSLAVVEPWQDIVKEILIISIPITIGACIYPMVNAIDSMIVMRRLQAVGFTLTESRVLFGKLGGYCSSLVGMPQVLTQAIVMSLVPAIAAGYKVGDYEGVKDNMKFSMRATMLMALPCTVGMVALAYPILLLLYPMQAEEVKSTALVFAIMSLTNIFEGPLVTLTGILQGINKQMLPVKNMAIGAVFKVLLTYILVGIRPINVNGASVGTIVFCAIGSYLCMKDLKKNFPVEFDPKDTYVKPLLASLVMGVCARLSYNLFMMILGNNSVCCLLAIVVGVLVYAVAVFAFKAITLDELRKFPKGDKLARIAGKFVRR